MIHTNIKHLSYKKNNNEKIKTDKWMHTKEPKKKRTSKETHTYTQSIKDTQQINLTHIWCTQMEAIQVGK